MSASTCRSCGAAIRWLVISPGGKRMPIDAEPHPEGNILAGLTRGTVLSAVALAGVHKELPDEPLYRSHFVTCPDAKDWRR